MEIKKFILLHLLLISIISSPNQAPDEWQDAEASCSQTKYIQE